LSTSPNGRHLGPFDTPTSTRADYIAMVERVDAGVGRILATLDKLGLRRTTLVIFTNDNGGEWLTNAGPLFHHKGSVWEGGIRVPAIMRWPGRILAATGAQVPADARPDGINLLPVLEGRVPEIERALFWRVQGQRAVRAAEWKLVFDGGRPLLFNLRADVGERRNLIGQRPEIASRLRSLLEAWQADVDSEAKKTIAQE
jgi:arylsulfatase A-like enzyme